MTSPNPTPAARAAEPNPRQDAEDFDVIVVGGGPAGATVAAAVALRGHRVLLLERQTFPRYQIGESLLPSTVHGVCRILGVADEVAAAGFQRKRGGTFRWGRSRDAWHFDFALSPRLADPTSFAFQVERSKFDAILLRNARRVGVDVREGCRVGGVVADDERVHGVRWTDPGGDSREARARYVVDASGNGSRIHTHVGGGRTYSDFFRNIAVFGYFAGGKRLPSPDDGNIFCAAFEEGWLWYIPLRDDLTSVGAVVSRSNATAIQRDPAATWRRLIDACPEVKGLLSGVPQATETPYDQVRVRRDWSYWKSTLWRPGMVLIGDAACFVDPVLSSGVHLATYGALLAARSINSSIAGLDETRCFDEFEARYRHEYGLFYSFVISFYDTQQDERSYFWKARKVTDVGSTDLEAFVELVGGLASGDTSITGPGWASEQLEAFSADIDAAVGRLADSDGLRNPLFESPTVRRVFQEGTVLQERGIFGCPLEDEEPVRPGGLVASEDGLEWIDSGR
ncbi:tryptophan 7-halogenase [Streptantibioticus ferralitis]|uniref:Tryptophan 7-halogenase n=1 Tax=Streptantibioticus ferralitis TaxID=236510 RepID=A0ABT5Z8D9_9ACTN|nr:tryptophan 7-halogenase [Streptantibioticus ferralitis]MDF2260096.1 tryptophan 7-halogenase [Streptantibioticus ferralitis]